MKLIMKLILILLSFSFTLQADYETYYLSSECNSKENFAKMEVSSIWNTDLNTTKAECIFSNGNKIKMKLGIGRHIPHCQGSDPDLWASIWVNEVKVVSKKSTFCPNGPNVGLCSFYIKAYNNTVELCDLDTNSEYYKNYEEFNTPPPKTTDFICQKIKIDDINGTKDDIEYPKNGKKLKVGNFKNFYYKNKNFCNNFLKNGKYTLPLGSKKIGTRSYTSSGVIEFFRMRKADYDNDGFLDEVYRLKVYTHARDRDYYYILPKDNNISKMWPKISEDNLIQYKKLIFPDDTTSVMLNDYFSLLVPIPTNGEKSIRLSYFLYPYPFIYNGVVYFDIYSNNYDIGAEHIIVKLLPNNRVEHLCYFYEIEENY